MKRKERATNAARIVAVLLGAALQVLAGPARSQVALPQHGQDQHLGVVTCAGSTCHGATRESAGSSVLQTEFVIWHREDKHAGAYKVLLNEQSRRIARNLGLAAAEKADICLDCHADNVPPSMRGKRFQLSDGVGCEACHGGAERYLGPHLSADATHAQNLSVGMYPTEDPAARARLCLSCHLGTRDKLATHRIMGAGHPRLSFELDTFSDIQPAHFRVDADYRQRKQAANGATLWARGQVTAASAYLDLLRSHGGGGQGLFPELVFFDCHGCHRSLHGQRWQPRPGDRLPPGTVRLNDSSLLMLRHVVRVAVPEARAALEQAIAALHQASLTDMAATRAAAKRLQAMVAGIEAKVATRELGASDMAALLQSVVADGVRGEYADYAGAEQAAMALGSLIQSMRAAGALDAARAEALNAELGRLYEVLEDDSTYEPERMAAAMRGLQGAL